MRTASLLAVLLALLLLPLAGHADDESPGARFDKTVAAFPKPAAAEGFDVAGEVRMGKQAIGRFRLAARAAPLPDAPESVSHWLLESLVTAKFEEGTFYDGARSYVTAALAPTQGELRRTDSWGETSTYTWSRIEDAFRVDVKSDVRAPMSKQAAIEGSSITNLASLVLFARLAPKGAATYETRTFDPGWNYLEAEEPFRDARIGMSGSQKWRNREARVAVAKRRGDVTVVALDPETGDLRGIEIREKGKPDLLLLPAGDATADEEDWFAVPSTTPRGCAMRVALAFAASDVGVFEKVIHWPTLKKNMRAQISGSMTDEAFRRAILAQFEAHKEDGAPCAEAEAALRKQAEGFTVEMKGEDGAVITFPRETYGDMKVEVGRVAGAWYLVRLPGN